jgi:hypothetical protein
MCLPALPALAIAASVASAAGAVQGGLQANAQGKYESEMNKRNAALEIEGYQEDRNAAQDQRRDFWRKVGATKGQQVAAMAANGIDVGYGTAERIQQDTQQLANEDATNLYKNQQQQQRGRLINASNFTAEAKAARQSGKAAMVGSFFQAASSLIGGASQAMSLGAKMGGGSSTTGTVKNTNAKMAY